MNCLPYFLDVTAELLVVVGTEHNATVNIGMMLIKRVDALIHHKVYLSSWKCLTQSMA